MVTSDEAERAIAESFAVWLATMEACRPLASPQVPMAAPTDELDAILRLQATRDLAYRRVGSWSLSGPWNLPDSIRGAPTTYDCIGHAPNGDLICARRAPGRADRCEVWLVNHELACRAETIAESIAAFAFMAALDADLANGPPPYEPDEATVAQGELLDEEAYFAILDTQREVFEAAWHTEIARRFAILSGRVAPTWQFSDVYRGAPAGFVRYTPTLTEATSI